MYQDVVFSAGGVGQDIAQCDVSRCGAGQDITQCDVSRCGV